MTWAAGPLLAYDCETTGVDVENDRIVTAAVVAIDPGVSTQVRSTVINPGVPVPDEAARVHGWTTDRVQAEGKPPSGELDWIADDLTRAFTAGTPVVIANAPYDLTLLDRELRRHGLPTLDDRLDGRPVAPVLDPLCIDKAVDRYRKGGRKLTDLCAHYGVRLEGAHDATADAFAAARVVWQMGRRAALDTPALRALYEHRGRQAPHIVRAFISLGEMPLAELHEVQQRWYAEQAESLAAFWRQKANEEEHRADVSDDPGERDVALRDVGDLRDRADNVSTEWPVVVFR